MHGLLQQQGGGRLEVCAFDLDSCLDAVVLHQGLCRDAIGERPLDVLRFLGQLAVDLHIIPGIPGLGMLCMNFSARKLTSAASQSLPPF